MIERILKRAIKHYGENHQLIKAAEECTELAKECLKENHKNIIEEAADVTIMIEQLRLMNFWDEDRFQREIIRKANRLNDYINNEERIERNELQDMDNRRN